MSSSPLPPQCAVQPSQVRLCGGWHRRRNSSETPLGRPTCSSAAPKYQGVWSTSALRSVYEEDLSSAGSSGGCIPPPTRLHVNLTQLVVNWQALQAHALPETTVAPTLKADAYGHGAVPVALALQRAGARVFMVAALREAVQLRRAGIQGRIVVMSGTPPRAVPVAADLGLELTVFDQHSVHAYAAALAAAGSPALAVHVKVDSGMGRIGVLPTEAAAVASALQKHSSALHLRGVYTHYSKADEDEVWTRAQHATFSAAVTAAFGADTPVHTCNSAALLLDPSLCGSLARTGIALYGGVASAVTAPLPGMGYALTWSTWVAQVKTLPAGHAVGYGNTYHTSEAETVVVLPVGYSNGLRRGPTNQGHVLLHGTKCPIRGRVSMEKLVVGVQHLVDAGVQVAVGDTALLLGAQEARAGEGAVGASGAEAPAGVVSITPGDAAAAIGTIDYEVFTGLLPATPRWGGDACGVQYLWPQGQTQTL